MDYTKMKATKQPKKHNVPEKVNVSKKDTNKVRRILGKVGISWILVAVCMAIGILSGWLINKFAFASDTFEMVAYANGETDIYIGKDEEFQSYTELGVKCIAFGKDQTFYCTVNYYYRDDLTNDEVLVDKIDTNTPGIYYAVYTTSYFKYKSVTLIRNIIVTGEEDNG